MTMSYKYIHSASTFTTVQKDFYEKNGYIVMKNNVEHELLNKCYNRFVEIVEGIRPLTGNFYTRIIKDPLLKKKNLKGEYTVNKLQDILEDDVLGQYARCKSVLEVVENIIGPNITAFHSMLINKPPNSHEQISKHPLHQDLIYLPFRPAEKIVGAWTAMEKVDIDNGCLFMVPGSHISPLYEHYYQNDVRHALYMGVKGMDHLQTIDIIMDKGDTVFFHPSILHGSHPNRTDHFRKAISVQYADSNCDFIDTKNTFHEPVIKESEGLLQGIFKTKISYIEFVKAKSVLVKGPPGNFQKFDSHL